MKKRPLVFVLLGILHLLVPIFNLLVLKIKTGMEWAVVLDNVLNIQGVKNIVDFWFIFPLAGIALLSVKAWAYPFFVGVQMYAFYNHIFYEKFTWPYVSERPFVGPLFLMAINLAIIIYFSLPHVRRPFFDRRMRWWEARPRYGSDIPCFVSLLIPSLEHSGILRTKILNISESGAFLEMRPGLHINCNMRANFEGYGQKFSLTARVINHHIVNGVEGIGIQFVFTSWSERRALKKFIKKLSLTFQNSLSTDYPKLAA
ncbi:MAG: PilZ domain-containing protein [Bdellovibrio sp.]|nr:PilZ domain-containing protein [Bdellovibrio sp.]